MTMQEPTTSDGRTMQSFLDELALLVDEANKGRTLFVTDAEMIRRIGAPQKLSREVIKSLDANRASGFPPKQKLWGSRRYWPAVRQWLDHYSGLAEALPPGSRRKSQAVR